MSQHPDVIRRLATNDGSFGPGAPAVPAVAAVDSVDLDALADKVVVRLERKVLEELERRSRYRLPGVF